MLRPYQDDSISPVGDSSHTAGRTTRARAPHVHAHAIVGAPAARRFGWTRDSSCAFPGHALLDSLAQRQARRGACARVSSQQRRAPEYTLRSDSAPTLCCKHSFLTHSPGAQAVPSVSKGPRPVASGALPGQVTAALACARAPGRRRGSFLAARTGEGEALHARVEAAQLLAQQPRQHRHHFLQRRAAQGPCGQRPALRCPQTVRCLSHLHLAKLPRTRYARGST